MEVIVLNIKVQVEFNSTLKGSYTMTKWDVSQESKNTRIHRPFEKKYKYNSHEQIKGKI